MTGLLGLIIGVILLVAIVAIFFLTIEKIVSDPLVAKIGKIVIGVIALIFVITAAWGALFGGAAGLPHMDGRALISFAIGILIIIIVVYLLNLLIAFFGFMVAELKYLLGIVALIAILALAGTVLYGGATNFWSQATAERNPR